MLYLKAVKGKRIIYFEVTQDQHPDLINGLIDSRFTIKNSNKIEFETNLLELSIDNNLNEVSIIRDYDNKHSECFTIEEPFDVEAIFIYIFQTEAIFKQYYEN